MVSLTNLPFPFEVFRFDCTKQVWYVLVKSKKLYHMVAEWVMKLCEDQGIKYIDARSGYNETMSVTEITMNIGWEGEEDNGVDVEWLTLSGEIWYARTLAKDFGGRWDPKHKVWDSVSSDALPKLLQRAYEYGYPLAGNFNWDGRCTSFLGSHGAYLDCEAYKWQLHKTIRQED